MPRTNLIAWTFFTAFGTENADQTIRLVSGSGSGVHGAATVVWEAQHRGPSMNGPAAADGRRDDTFWCLLFGITLFLPLADTAVGAAVKTPHTLAALGIPREVIHKIRDRVAPATCTVFVVADDGITERLMDEVSPFLPDETLLILLHFDPAFSARDLFEGDNSHTGFQRVGLSRN